MPIIRSRAATAGTAFPTLAAAVLLGWTAPEAAWAQPGSALFAVGDGSSRSQRSAKPAPTPAGDTVGAGTPIRDPAATAGSTPVRRETRRRSAPARQAVAINLNGRWHDSQCIPLAGVTRSVPLYVQREFEFDDARKTWQLQASVFTSSACLASTRMLTYRGAGSFVVNGKASAAANAYDATFGIHRWSATPETREGVLALLNDRCGSGDFEEGRMLDLSVTGCMALGIRPIAQAPQETELVSVSNGRFFLGSRSFAPGLGDDRPAQLSSYGLVRTP